ncbi:GTPase Era [Rubrobacter indicoceani]|uniref:GTPase Era n=1 Tax=Rubrobacter indicoceani TaxID=2051957 RepID=UPI000E5B3BEC|nr:GTPase Era [Rubrobacter indicoceani]
MTEAVNGFRSGFVAVVGRPNVGKSTLVNRLVGRKVSITSPRPQTTRNPVRGVRNGDGFQIVFIDTPGSQKPRDTLRRRMQEQVVSSLSEADAVLFILDASQAKSGFGKGDRYVADLVSATNTPAIACLNKLDLLKRKDEALPLVKELSEIRPWHEVYLLSATTGLNTKPLMKSITALLPEGPRYFPDGVVTDYPEGFIISEFIREKALSALREEIPHAVAVEIDEVEEKDSVTVIYAILHVERKSQRMVVLGKNGQTIRKIGTEARQEVERLLGVRIYLDLKVKVTPGWRSNPQFLERLGL